MLLATALTLKQPAHGDVLDLVLLALGTAAAVTGFRRGLLVGLLSLVGFAGGGALGARFGPALAQSLVGGAAAADIGGQRAMGQRVLALVIVAAFGAVGQAILVTAGARLRTLIHASPLGVVDAAGGAAADALAVLLVAWLIASALALAPLPRIRGQVRSSLILNAVNGIVPGAMRDWSSRLDRLLQQHALPSITGPFAGVPTVPEMLPAPNAGAVPPALRAAGPDIVKITGTAECDRVQEGSGFVISRDHVLTNAHVVAGVRDPSVALPDPGSGVLRAHVVLYDPNRDVAILYVPGLHRAALSFAAEADTGADAVVAGYPENGPLTAVPARIAGEQRVTGPNIYDDKTVTREVYTVRARVRPGNSGGPLLAPDGQVYGVVFAASTDSGNTGYALTAAEVAVDVSDGRSATVSVSSGSCD